MPSRKFHALDIEGVSAPAGAERRRLKMPNGVLLERALLDGEWATTAVSVPAEDFTIEQAQTWAKAHGHEGTVQEATGEQRGDAADVVEMETVRHHDSVGILGEPQTRPDGTVLLMGRLAKPGILPYHDQAGNVRRELVPESTLRDPAWLRSVARAPVTLEHPVRDGELVDVDPDNVSDFGVGDVDGRVDVDEDDFVVIRLATRRRDAIDSIRRGDAVELSPGYNCSTDPTPGIHPVFGAYDAIQVSRRCNHVALTDMARGGHDIGLRRDSALLVQARDSNQPPQEGPMDKVKLAALLVALGMPEADAKRCDSMDDALELVKDKKRDGASVRDLYDELSFDFRKVSSARDALQGKLDAAMAELEKLKEDAKGKEDKKGDSEKLAARIAFADQRTELLTLAKAHGVDMDDAKRADNAGIRLAVVKAALPSTPDDATADYVQGVFETLTRDGIKEPTEQRADAAWDHLSAGSGKYPDPKADNQRRDASDDPYRMQIENCRG